MAQALISGFLDSGVNSKNLIACDINDPAKQFCEKKNVEFYSDAANMMRDRPVDIVLVCVKPDALGKVLPALRGRRKKDCMLISICAGVQIHCISSILKDANADEDKVRIVRVMPNVCCMVHESAMGFVMQEENEEDSKIIQELMGKVGLIKKISDEAQIDGVTGLSGSGPAFVFQFIEALADGGVRSGLPRETALQLAAQTVLGSAKMVLKSGKHPGELKDMVTSPSGTTIAGVHALEKGGMRGIVMNAVYKSTNRSKELSKL